MYTVIKQLIYSVVFVITHVRSMLPSDIYQFLLPDFKALFNTHSDMQAKWECCEMGSKWISMTSTAIMILE